MPAIAQPKPFSLGYTEFKPFIWKENGQPTGIYVDILKEALEQRMGIPLTLRHLPQKRIEAYIKNGELDGFIDLSTADRLAFSTTGYVPVAVGMVAAFTYKDHPKLAQMAEADTLSELKAYTILTTLGDDWSKAHLKGFKVDAKSKRLGSTFKKLALKRGDLILKIEQVGQYNILQQGLENKLVQVPGVALSPTLYQLLVSNKSAYINILDDLDTTLTAMINDGTIDAINRRYQGGVTVQKLKGSQKTKIKYIHHSVGSMATGQNEIVNTFNQSQSRYHLKAIDLELNIYKQAIKLMLVGGQPPDILTSWAGYRTQFLVESGFIEPIDNLWASAKLSKVFPKTTAKAMTYNQKKYAIPLTHHILVFLYNKKIFASHRLSPPKTWEDLLIVAERLKDLGIVPFALGSKNRWPAQFWFDYILVRTAGYEYRERLISGNASFVAPEVKRVFKIWRALIEGGLFNKSPGDSTYAQTTNMVANGKAAMTLNGTWNIGDFERDHAMKAGEDFDIFPFPTIDHSLATVLLGSVDVIMRTKSAHPDASQRALQHFTSLESQMIFSKYGGVLAPNINVPKTFYSSVLNKASDYISQAEYEVYPLDLSTPPHVAELCLDLFKNFIAAPEQYPMLLKQAEKDISEAFRAKSNEW